MLDAFLHVVVESEKKASVYQSMVHDMQKLPASELLALAEGELKLGFGMGTDDEWLKKFEGTELYEQALQLEQKCLEVDINQKQRDMEEQQLREGRPDFYAERDSIALQKRILDFELNSQRLGNSPGAQGELPAEGAAELEDLPELPEAVEPTEGAGKVAAATRFIDSFLKESMTPQQRAALSIGGSAAALGGLAGLRRGEAHGEGAQGAARGAIGTLAGGTAGAALGNTFFPGGLGALLGGVAGAHRGLELGTGGYEEKTKQKKKEERASKKEASATKEAFGGAMLAGAKGLAQGAKGLVQAGAQGYQRRGLVGAGQALQGKGLHQVGQAAQWANKNRGAAAGLAGAGLMGAGAAGAAIGD